MPPPPPSCLQLAMTACVESVVGKVHEECIGQRLSAQKNYISVTIGPVWVESPDQVLQICEWWGAGEEGMGVGARKARRVCSARGEQAAASWLRASTGALNGQHAPHGALQVLSACVLAMKGCLADQTLPAFPADQCLPPLPDLPVDENMKADGRLRFFF